MGSERKGKRAQESVMVIGGTRWSLTSYLQADPFTMPRGCPGGGINEQEVCDGGIPGHVLGWRDISTEDMEKPRPRKIRRGRGHLGGSWGLPHRDFWEVAASPGLRSYGSDIEGEPTGGGP